MPLSSPTYSASYSKGEADANMATAVGFTDNANSAVTMAAGSILVGASAVTIGAGSILVGASAVTIGAGRILVGASSVTMASTNIATINGGISALAAALSMDNPYAQPFVTRRDLDALVATLRALSMV